MTWADRTLDELRSAEPRQHDFRKGVEVDVNYGEATLLLKAGAKVVGSGSRDLDQGTQTYSFEGKTYFWLAGYGSGSRNDKYPAMGAVDPRILDAVEANEKLGWW